MAHGTTGVPRDIARSPMPPRQLSESPGGPPRGLARLAGVVCGRWTKFVVVGIWLLIIVAASPFAGKLSGAEKNDASAYPPASAESTQKLNAEAAFQSKNFNPAVVVYVRTSGITAADLAKADADARHFATLAAVRGRVSTPAGDPGLTTYSAGPAANAADEVKVFNGIDSTLLYATLAVVIVLLLLIYRSPVLWLLPILCASVALTAAQAVISYLTVNGQTEGILVVLVIGASTDYALLLIARYREELRRHEDRHAAMAVAMRWAGNPCQCADRGRRDAVPDGRRGQRHLWPRPGRRDRHRGGRARHGHAAPGDSCDLRQVDLLVGQARLRQRGACQPRPVVACGRGPLAGSPSSVTAQSVLAKHFPAGAGVPEPGPRPADMVAKLTVPGGRGERYREARRLNWVA